jgi:hypothetical protein
VCSLPGRGFLSELRPLSCYRVAVQMITNTVFDLVTMALVVLALALIVVLLWYFLLRRP